MCFRCSLDNYRVCTSSAISFLMCDCFARFNLDSLIICLHKHDFIGLPKVVMFLIINIRKMCLIYRINSCPENVKTLFEYQFYCLLNHMRGFCCIRNYITVSNYQIFGPGIKLAHSRSFTV